MSTLYKCFKISIPTRHNYWFSKFFFFSRNTPGTPPNILHVSSCVWSTSFYKYTGWTRFSTVSSSRTASEWSACPPNARKTGSTPWFTYFLKWRSAISTSSVRPGPSRNTIRCACYRWTSSTRRRTYSYGFGIYCCWSRWFWCSGTGKQILCHPFS